MKRPFFFIALIASFSLSLFAEDAPQNPLAASPVQATSTAAADAGFPDSGLRSTVYQRVAQDNSTAQLVTNFGALKNYRLTPGDIFSLAIVPGGAGNLSSSAPIRYPLQLLEDYTLELPLIGTVSCRGKNFLQLKKEILDRVKQTFSLFYADFSFSQPAQFNVFVYGSVKNPGQVLATPLTTLSQAISTRGGFFGTASYRTIRLIRNGQPLLIDLSQYYTRGHLSQNPFLMPGDTIEVPPAATLVHITGQIAHPGEYELTQRESVFDLITHAGGILLDASTETYEIERYDLKTAKRIYINSPIADAKEVFPQNGDRIHIRSFTENATMLTVDGAIYGKRHPKLLPETAPSTPLQIHVPFSNGATVLSVLDAVGGPTPYARTDEAFIKRRGSLTPEPIPLQALWESRNPELDLPLYPGDTVVIPMLILKIFVGGEVRSPGGFAFSHSFRPMDYIMMAGGFNNSANMRHLYKLDLNGMPHEISLDSKLSPGDILFIKKDHVSEVAKAFQNVTVYTNFLNTIMGTINSGIYFARQVKSLGVELSPSGTD